jgi:hypothetical protein
VRVLTALYQANPESASVTIVSNTPSRIRSAVGAEDVLSTDNTKVCHRWPYVHHVLLIRLQNVLSVVTHPPNYDRTNGD